MPTAVRRRTTQRLPAWGEYFKSPANRLAFKDPRQVGTILRQHDLSENAVRILFPILRTNLLEHMAASPTAAQDYIRGVAEGTRKSFFGFGQMMAMLSTSVINGARRAGPEAHDWFLAFFLNLPLGWKGKTYPAMSVFERKAVPEYGERFSAVREAMAMGQMGFIPKMIEGNHPKTDEALTIHFRMMFDWFTDVVETAVRSMTTILPALIKADHPRAAQALELVKYFSKDQDVTIMGYACKALERAAIVYYDKDRTEFERIVEILIRKATKSVDLKRRANALSNLSNIYRFLTARGEGLPLRLRIIDIFTKNSSKVGEEQSADNDDFKHKRLFAFRQVLFSFAMILCTTGEKVAALEITSKCFISITAANSNIAMFGGRHLQKLLAVAIMPDKGSPDLVQYIIAALLEDTRYFTAPEVPAYLINLALTLKEAYPKEAKQLMERAICLIRIAETSFYVKGSFYSVLQLTPETVNKILTACQELGIDPLKSYMLAEVIGESDIDNKRVGLLRDEVTKLRGVDRSIADYFEWMIHGRPSPQDLEDVRTFLSIMRREDVPRRKLIGRGNQTRMINRGINDAAYLAELSGKSQALMPILLKMEAILSEVYEYNPNLVRNKLQKLTKKLRESKFVQMRMIFIRALERDCLLAAKLIGPLMNLAASSHELSPADSFKLVSQLHYLGYALFNTAYAEVFDRFKPARVKDAQELFASMLLAVKAVGLYSPELDHALERLGEIRPDISAETLTRVDLYELMAVVQLIDRGVGQTIIPRFHREVAGPINEIAGDLKNRDIETARKFQFYTDNYIRASLLHQLSEASLSLITYLRSARLFPLVSTLAQQLREEDYTEWHSGPTAYSEQSGTKLIGQSIRLARGVSPVQESGLEVWIEKTDQGILELYVYDDLFAPRGRAFLNGQELSVSQVRSLLDVTLSNATLMAMWRHSD